MCGTLIGIAEEVIPLFSTEHEPNAGSCNGKQAVAEGEAEELDGPLSECAVSLFGWRWRWLGCARGIVCTAAHVVGFGFSENHVVDGLVEN